MTVDQARRLALLLNEAAPTKRNDRYAQWRDVANVMHDYVECSTRFIDMGRWDKLCGLTDAQNGFDGFLVPPVDEGETL